jgi:uncharacterized protein involved in outer membrane biogenesis
MNKRLFLASAATAFFALAACQQKQPEVLDTNPDPMANVLANAPKVELPPAIAASVTMRCKEDNSLVYVDFFKGDTQARLRTKKDGAPIQLKAEKAGDAYVDASGYSLKGDAKKITLKQPGKGELTCHT